MMIRNPKDLRRSRAGTMPFALLAVALLLVSSTFCVVYANVNQAKENTEGVTDELCTIDDVISSTEDFIREGLGKIIYDISADIGGGTLIDRVQRFDSAEEEWFSQNFPRSDRGITVTVQDEDFKIDVQSTRVSSNDLLSDRSVSSYLRAVGSVKATFTGDAGMTTKTMDITADGTSGLPFIVDCATRFELSSEGDASMLTQLVSYQLTSLAQSRIINGYGLRSISGGMGTIDIITKDDVQKAFRNALDVVETLCFRSNGMDDMSLFNHGQIDLAEKMVLRNGYYEIDVGSIIAQALLSIIDTIVMKWVDYIGLDKVAEIVDRILDVAKEFINTVISFITNNHEDNRNSARIYIKEVMQSCGYSEYDYRYVRTSEFFFEVEGGTIDVQDRHGNHEQLPYGDFLADCECFECDILAWEGWENYVVDYNRNRNSVMDYVRGTLQSICSGMASNYGVVKVRADEFDEVSFMDSFSSAIDSCLSRSLDRLTYVMESSLREDNVTDLLLASIYSSMVENRDGIFRENEYISTMNQYAQKSMFASIKLNPEYLQSIINACMEKDFTGMPRMKQAKESYSMTVDRMYELYDGVMNSPRNQGSSVLKELIIAAGKEVLRQDFVKESVRRTSIEMMNEVKEHMRSSCSYGTVGLEGLESYSLYDWRGNIYEEFTNVSDDLRLSIQIIDPTKNPGNYHSINTKGVSYASYVSVFTVKVTGNVDYVTNSMSGVDRSLGRIDSAFKGTLDIDMRFDINCTSAWSLTGAEYSASRTLFDDIWNSLLNAVGPLLEPLREIYERMRAIFTICNETVIEINSYATELIDRLYAAIMEPLERFAELIDDCISRNLCDIIENLCGFVEGFDIGASNQKITFTFFGLHLTVELRLATVVKTTKNIVKLTLSGEIGGTEFSAFIDMKKNAKNGLMVRGGGSIENKDCALNLVLDPEMKFGSKLVTLNGTIREVDIDACLPYRETYDELKIVLSDIPAAKAALSNIPLPIPGYKGSFDMGIDLKYNLPLGTGLMINEFESNPAGKDDGAEWVELYNATGRTIDLSGYILVPESNESKAIVITGTSIGPFEKKVITFEKQSLNNSKSGKNNGESISLYSPEGEKVDSTPWKKDTYNDDKTWQRKADGSTAWVLEKGTPGSSNGHIIKTNALVKEFIIDCFLKAADRAFEEMGNHLRSVDEITAFLHRTLELFVKNVIDTIAEIVVSASVFISLELTDYAQTQHYGLKVGFEMNSDLVREGIYWLLKQIGVLQDIVREPCCNDIGDIVCENTYLITTVYTSISTPKFLSTLETEEIEIGYKAGVNITGISDMIWGENGKWKAILGVVAEDLDASKLPKGLRSDSDKRCDLWMIKVELSKSDAPKSG
ncbi:MAG: lamin tail domain-containing protein [Candidatus Methanomethylophilaceae archaeon]|nr:lamin tail domain-containing protein [Candidatus Methanomethylophilaceae archaeon]